LLALLITVALFGASLAEVVQPGDDFWYLDQADVLSQKTEGEIFFANQRLYDACGAEIVIVAIDTTSGMAIDDYAYSLFNEWEIGGSKYLGFLLLMAIEDQDYYAMPGTMLDAYIDSAEISDMLERCLEPYFAKGEYDSGVRLFFEEIYVKTVDVLNLNLSIEDAIVDYNAFVRSENVESSPVNSQTVRYDGYPSVRRGISLSSVVLIVFLLIVLLKATKRFRRNARAYTPPPSYGYVPPRTRSNASSVMTGLVLGRMAGAQKRRRHVGMPRVGGPRMHGGMNRGTGRAYGAKPSSSFAARSSGVNRIHSSRSFGGFGGASRSGGSSRGPATRGGGAGRFSRK